MVDYKSVKVIIDLLDQAKIIIDVIIYYHGISKSIILD